MISSCHHTMRASSQAAGLYVALILVYKLYLTYIHYTFVLFILSTLF